MDIYSIEEALDRKREDLERKNQARLAAEELRLKRVYLIQRDGIFCPICNVSMTKTVKPGDIQGDNMMTIDHIIPKSAGGTDDIENLRLLCRACNAKKGSKIPENQEAKHTTPVPRKPRFEGFTISFTFKIRRA